MKSLLLLSGGGIAGIVIGSIVFILLVLFLAIVPIKPYFTALFSNCHISCFKLISLKFRKVNVMPILNAYIMAKKSKLNIKFNELEAILLAGGSCEDVVKALIKARGASISLTFEDAKSIELSSHNVIEAIESVILPKQFEITSIKAITKDNFELEVSAKISIKARLDSIAGGLGEDTLEAKVSKYIMTKISSLSNHKNATPYNLTENILKGGLDNGNGYQLLAVDISSINVSRDIGAELAMKDLERIKMQAQIDADRQKNYAQLQAEQMKIKTQEMKTAVLEAEAEVPKAIAEAIRDGRFSVMDYYKLMNLQADTAMRRAMINKDEEPRG